MYARLLENQDLDSWMTYELMERAIDKVANAHEFLPDDQQLEMKKTIMTYNLQTGTTAKRMELKGDVDHFFNFMSIKVDRDPTASLKHVNRPDGVFGLKMNTSGGNRKDMLLFYEGDVHA